jgi:hypothetical protein
MTDGWTPPDAWSSPGAPTPATPPADPVSLHKPGSTVPRWAQPNGRTPLVPLRPLTVGEILDGAVTLIRHNPGALLGLGAVAAAVSAGTQIALNAALGTSDSSSDAAATAGVTVTALGLLVSYVIGIALSGAAAVALREGLIGTRLSTAEILSRTRGHLRALVGGSVLAGLLTVLASVVFVIPGVYLYVSYTFVGCVIVMEESRARPALRRSRRLIKGAWWRVFGVNLLVRLISGVVGVVISVPATLLIEGSSVFSSSSTQTSLGAQSAVAALTALATVLTAPFGAAVVTLLYADRRMRVEGLDVALQQALAAQP